MKTGKVMTFIKKHERVLKALLMSFLPLLCLMAACAVDGKTIGDISLPASEWNDELVYFKQVQGMLKFGYPQGYFGFNESRSLLFSFAAWSPVLVWPWLLWGLVFGFGLMSPILCNLAVLSLAVFLFVWLTKPNLKQLFSLTLLFACFTPFNRYMAASMPEIICFFVAIVALGMGVNYLEKEHPGKLAGLFALTAVMTLMRPYLVVFMLLPIYLWIKKQKWKGLLGSAGVLLGTLFSYALIKHYFSAAYFAPLFQTDWITGGLYGIFYRLYAMGKSFFAMAYQAFLTGLPGGAYFAGFLSVFFLLLVQSVHNFRKKQKKQLTVNLYLSACFFGMLIALLLMYKLMEGSRHLVTFIAVGIFAVSLMETKFYKKTILLAMVFVYLYAYHGEAYPHYYQIPYRDAAVEEERAYWQDIYEKELVLSRENTPSYDNVVIWQLFDTVEEQETASAWQFLYDIPAGFGISCCEQEYLLQNYDALQSRYLMTVPGGKVDALCREKGAKLLGETEKMVLYRLR